MKAKLTTNLNRIRRGYPLPLRYSLNSLLRIGGITAMLLIGGLDQVSCHLPSGSDRASVTNSFSPQTHSPSQSIPVGAQAKTRLDAGEPADAEYAVRWDPSEGGLRSPEEVLAFLNAPKTHGETSEVRYFDLPPPPNAPPDSTIILRQRSMLGSKSETRLKYRRKMPLVEPWACPTDSPYKQDEEVDISFAGIGELSRVYSYSCTLSASAPPASLAAVPKHCKSQMVRYKFHKFKIEEWTHSGGKTQLEVSYRARDTSKGLAKFETFVSALRGRGVKPSDQSKTELGSQCP